MLFTFCIPFGPLVHRIFTVVPRVVNPLLGRLKGSYEVPIGLSPGVHAPSTGVAFRGLPTPIFESEWRVVVCWDTAPRLLQSAWGRSHSHTLVPSAEASGSIAPARCF